MNGVSNIIVTEDITLFTFRKVPADLKTMANIFEAFAREGINIDMISQSAPDGNHVDISFTIMGEQLVGALELVNRQRGDSSILKPLIHTGNGKITLYGEEMRVQPGVAAHAIACAVRAEAEIHLITTSEVDISLLVDSAHLPQALSDLRRAFEIDPKH